MLHSWNKQYTTNCNKNILNHQYIYIFHLYLYNAYKKGKHQAELQKFKRVAVVQNDIF